MLLDLRSICLQDIGIHAWVGEQLLQFNQIGLVLSTAAENFEVMVQCHAVVDLSAHCNYRTPEACHLNEELLRLI